MSENWDFYFLHVDHKIASIFVDLGLHADAPEPGFPVLAYLRLHMLQPRHDGLSSQDEYEALLAIEQQLEVDLVDSSTKYVGRCTTNGCRDFYFYASAAEPWTDRVKRFMSGLPHYKFEAGHRDDPEWQAYFEFLFPNVDQLESISNRSVCSSLERQGDSLTQAREIDHWIYFGAVADADAFTQDCEHLGFSTRDRYETGEFPIRHCVQLWRNDVPAYAAIDEIVRPLRDLAIRHHGEYDGWETFVVREQSVEDQG